MGSVQELRYVEVQPRDVEGPRTARGAWPSGWTRAGRWRARCSTGGTRTGACRSWPARYRVRDTERGWRLVESVVVEQVLLHAGQRLPGEDGDADDELEVPEEL